MGNFLSQTFREQLLPQRVAKISGDNPSLLRLSPGLTEGFLYTGGGAEVILGPGSLQPDEPTVLSLRRQQLQPRLTQLATEAAGTYRFRCKALKTIT
jgi:hypothetical protein